MVEGGFVVFRILNGKSKVLGGDSHDGRFCRFLESSSILGVEPSTYHLSQ